MSHFWHSGGDLYVATMDSSLLVYEEGSSQPRTLLEEYTGYWETVFGDTLYFQSDGMRSIGLNSGDQEAAAVTESGDAVTDGRHVYYAPSDTLALHRCNMDGSEATQLLEDPVMPASWNFDQEYFYFRLFSDGMDGQESENIYRPLPGGPGGERAARRPAGARLPDLHRARVRQAVRDLLHRRRGAGEHLPGGQGHRGLHPCWKCLPGRRDRHETGSAGIDQAIPP